MKKTIDETAEESLKVAISEFKNALPSNDESSDIRVSADRLVVDSELRFNDNANKLRGIVYYLLDCIRAANERGDDVIIASNQNELAIKLWGIDDRAKDAEKDKEESVPTS